jgi:D-psicose/D-tagatose/L-ribulose 3-epimerase
LAIRIGFATWSLGDLSLTEYLPDLVDAGYDGVEIVGDLTRQPADDLRDVVEDHGLSVLSVIPTNEIDLAHPLRSLRQESVDAVRGLIDYSVAVGARRLVLREKPGRMRPIVGRQKEWTVLQQSLRSLVGHAAGMNVHLALLPVNRYEGFLVNTVRDANALLQTISDPGLDLELALSTYHMHL